MARRAWFEDIVKSVTRNFSTLLPWRFAVSITVIIVPSRLAPALGATAESQLAQDHQRPQRLLRQIVRGRDAADDP